MSSAIPATVENPVVLDLSASYGALIIAAYISCALWGINVMQSYMYYWNYPEDSWQKKTLADTAHKVLITKVPFFTLIQNWGRVSAVLASPVEALHEAWVGSIIVLCVQLYYLHRIARFASTTRHAHTWYYWLALIVLVALSILQVPLTAAYCAFSINKSNIFIPINLASLLAPIEMELKDLMTFQRIKRTGLVAAAIVDVVITIAMSFLLKDSHAIDGVYRSKRTSRTIRRLTIIIINTGLVTAVVAVASLILDETASGTDFYTAIAQYPQCSIYFSTLLANLNARHYVGGTLEVSNIEDLQFATTTRSRRDTESAGDRIVLGQLKSVGNSSGSETTQAASKRQDEKDGVVVIE